MTELRHHQQQALVEMSLHHKGILSMPTGAGKTLTMIFDAIRQFSSESPKTIAVVAPRILLADQLSSEFLEHILNASPMHVHTGETNHFSSTNPRIIRSWYENIEGHKIIFTTYNSLGRLKDAEIPLDTIYFDEAHHCIKNNFFPSTEYFSDNSNRCYFFTATPKYSSVITKPGMNDVEIFGNIICNVSAPDLVNNGYILSPKIQAKQMECSRDKDTAAERDCMTLLDTILNEDNMQKVLVAAPNTKVLMRMLAETEFMNEVRSCGYEVLWITSKYGAFINDKKVSRELFFETLNEYGKDDDKKFILIHYNILSEGINCPGLTSCVMMRNMDSISMAQMIGRVIRLHPDDAENLSSGNLTPGKVEDYVKSYGFVHVPVYDNHGGATSKQLQNVADTIFVKGQPMISVITR